MKHVALLLPDLEVGGAQRIILNLAEGLAGRGYIATLLVISGHGSLREVIPNKVNLIELCPGDEQYRHGTLALIAVLRLWRWLRVNRPAVLLSSVTGANIVALIVRQLLGGSVRVVIREAGNVDDVRGRIRLWLLRRLYPKADTVVALTPVMADKLAGRIGVPTSDIQCIPNAVDLDYLLKKGAEGIEGGVLDSDAKLVVSVGRLIPQKDYPTLIKAVAVLARSLPVRLVIIGEGEERNRLEQLIKSLGVERQVVLLGYDSNPWRWMTKADLYVLSSNSEGHPNSLLEALALRVPVVATAYDQSLCEMAQRHGFETVAVGDFESLASAMQVKLESEPSSEATVQVDGVSMLDRYESILFR